MKKILGLTVISMGLVLGGCSSISNMVNPTPSPEERKYQQAEEFFANGNFADAATLYSELGTYSDSSIKYKNAVIEQANVMFSNGEYESVIDYLEDNTSNEAKELISKCYLELGNVMFDKNEYEKALTYYRQSKEDVSSKINECNYRIAKKKYDNKKYEEAKEMFSSLGSYKDSFDYLSECKTHLEEAKEFFEIQYALNQSEEENSGNYYKNGNGATFTFYTDADIMDDWVGLGGRYVSICFPETAIHFKLVNKGSQALKNPIVKFEFTDVILKQVDDPFTGENHVRGVGGFGTAVLYTYSNLQPGTTSEDYMLRLNEAYFTNGSSGTLKITLSADNYKARTYTVSLKLI